ncbi:MAG: hypothetical protein MMC23_009100 [Stictis urceolatum]|nr:hypothetical protein [Stictis urceolata]
MEKLASAIQIEFVDPRPTRNLVKATMSVPKTKFDSDLKVLAVSDHKAAASCLAEAFEADRACMYFLDCPDTETWTAEQKWALHLRTFECVVYAHILSGLALGTPSPSRPGDFDAVALWMPPGKNMDDFFTMIRSGFWQLKWRYSKIGRVRFFDEFLPLLHLTKKQVMKERDSNSWYLVYLGTRKAARGKGHAGKLVRRITEQVRKEYLWGSAIEYPDNLQADAANLACYLESTNAANLPLYRRLGFETKTTIRLQEKSIELDIMTREPACFLPLDG